MFIECGLLFPILPGDSLLFAVGLFIAEGSIKINIGVACLLLTIAAFLGNVTGYEIGRAIGASTSGRAGSSSTSDDTRVLREARRQGAHPGTVPCPSYAFITVVAGVSRMDRRHFFVWSGVGALLWATGITLIGYFLGQAFPALKDNLELAILAIVAVSVVPMIIEFARAKSAGRVAIEETEEVVEDLLDGRD